MKIPYVFIVFLAFIGAITLSISLVFKKDQSNQLSQENQLSNANDTTKVYVALGDSYTIGEGVKESERWPNLITSKINDTGSVTQLAANPSKTGFTTADVLKFELDILASYTPDVVTILIGINDYVQAVTVTEYERNYNEIIDQVSALAPQAKIILVTTPDFGKAPAAQSFGDPEEISMGIEELNDIVKTIADERNIAVADVFAISQKAQSDRNYFVSDGVHPSAKQYIDWTDIIYPIFLESINSPK